MASRIIYPVVAAAGIATASVAAWWFQHPARPAAVPSANPAQGASAALARGPAPAVEVAKVAAATLVDDTQAVGTLRSRQSVMLRPEVSGRVTQLLFRDGARVRKGQLLVQLDDQLQRAQVQQSQAELSIALANHKRNQELAAQNFISQRTVDESAANLEIAQAKLALAQAAAARLRINAPFDGVAGIRSVNMGDYLKDGADIVNIEDMDAVYVDFRLPERYQVKIRRGQQERVDVDALPGRTFVATVQAIDPLVDTNGRSVGVRACIDNRSMALRPGMFARVTAVFGVREQARLVPEEALVPQGSRQYVFKLVEGAAKGTRLAQRVEVQVGLRRPGQVEVTSGLAVGDTVVTAGQQRLGQGGMPVRIMDMGRAGSAASAPPASPPAPPAVVATTAALPSPRPGPNPCLMNKS